MAIVRNVLVRVGADINPMQKEMTKAQKIMGGFSNGQKQALYSMQTNMKKLMAGTGEGTTAMTAGLTVARTALVALAAAAAAAFAVVATKSIKSAMDVVESENLFEVSMGNMAGAARQWSDELQKTLGLNAYEVRKNVGMFYNMTTSMGLAQNQAYKVSTGITKLAYDMSSFYNIGYDEMFEKLQAGLSGEMEPLKRLGIIVNETTTQLYALKTGMIKQGQTMTEQQKVLARYGVIMEATKNAQGDLARTITSPANQLRLLQTQLQLASINLGNAFMPIVERVLPILTNLATGLASVTSIFAQFMRALFGSNSAQSQNAQSAASAASAQSKLGQATVKAGAAAKKGVAGFDEINQLQEEMAANASNAADAMSTTPTVAKQDSSSSLPSELQELATKVKAALDPVKSYFNEIGDMLTSFWKNIQPYLQPIIDFFEKILEPVWIALRDTVINVFEIIKGVIQGALQIIQGIIEVFCGILTGNWDMVWKGLSDICLGAWTIIKAVFWGVVNELQIISTMLFDVLKTIWTVGATALVNLVIAIGKGLIDFFTITIPEGFKALITFFINLPTTIANALNGLADIVGQPFKDAFDRMVNWGAALFIAAKTVGENIVNGIMGFITSLPEKIENIFINIVSKISGFIGKIVNSIKSITSNFSSGFSASESGSGWTPASNAPTYGLDTPYQHASGFVVSKPTLLGRHLIGEAGAEALMPLENNSFVDSFASQIGNVILSAMQFNQPQQNQGPTEFIFQIDSSKLAKVMVPAITKENQRLGNKVIIQGV